jgi:DNA-binding MarR family transcriptional regulator
MAETRRPPSLRAQPSYLASQVSKYGRRHLEKALSEHDMVLIDHAVLTALTDLGPLSQQELADSLDLDKSHLVARLDRLQDRGLLARQQDPDDRRRNRLVLTSSGRALIKRLDPIAHQSQQGFLEALTESERATLVSLLTRVLDANDATRLGAPAEPTGAVAAARRRDSARRRAR